MAGPFACSLVVLVGASFFSPASGPTVSAIGSGGRSFDPDVARVRWRVHASGKSYKSALRKLDICREVLEKRLARLEGPRPAHRLGPSLDHESSEGTAGMQAQIMRMAMGQGGDDKKPGDKIRLAFQVTLEWKLAGDDLPVRQRQVDVIRDQLRELEVLDVPSQSDRDDEQEDDEKDEGEADNQVDGQENTIGTVRAAALRIEDGPTFSFSRRLSEGETLEVARLAFEQAERRAARIAKATGRSLGPLVTVTDSVGSLGPAAGLEKKQMAMINEMFNGGRPTFDDEDRPETELVSDSLRPIRFTVEVSATFELK